MTDAVQAAAAAVLGDIASEPRTRPVSPEQAAAGVVADMTAGYHGPESTLQERYRAADDHDAIERLAIENAPWRPHRLRRDQALLRTPQTQTQQSEQSAQPQAAQAGRRSREEVIDALSPEGFQEVAALVYARQAREYEADERAAEPLEDVFQGVDEWVHQEAVERARAEGYSAGYVAAGDEAELREDTQ